MNKVRNWKRSPDFEWTIDPCFLTLVSHIEEESISNPSDELVGNIALLFRNFDSMKLVLDREGFLWQEYHRIIEESSGFGCGAFIQRWIEDLDEAERLKSFSTKKFLSNYDKKIEENSEEIKECLRNCIAASCCSNDKLLLSRHVHTLRNSMVDTELGIKLFDRNEAEKFISCSENFDSSAAIQEALMTNFLRDIKHRIEKLQDIKLLYKNYRANGPIEPCIEEQVGERLFNDLDVLIGNCNLNCDREVKLGNAKADAIISSGRHKVVIELKYAHRDIEHGLSQQLPEYLDRKQTIYGIFLILLFDNDREQFEKKQTQLDNIKEKHAEKLSKYKIETYWINCSRKPPPSKQ